MKFTYGSGERVLEGYTLKRGVGRGGFGEVFYAVSDTCGHNRAPLSRGKLDGCIVECPLHFAQYDVRTGKLVDGPIAADLPVYQVRVDGDTVYVKR